jgi:putative hydrolase of the HAD superfamily
MLFAELDAVTIDGYGTLLVLDDPVGHLQEALRAHGVAASKESVARAFAAEAAHYRPRSHLGRDAATLAALRAECVAVFLEALESPLDPVAFTDDFIRALAFVPVSGVADTLERLRERDLRLAVVANWDCALPEHLAHLGLDRFFSTVVTSASAGAAKPDPAIFRVALELLEADPARALHVGDEPADEQGAAAAGMRFAPAPLASAFEGWA